MQPDGRWGDPGITEQLELAETTIPVPSGAGGAKTQTLQRAGLLKRLRFLYRATTTFSGVLGTVNKSPYGPLAGIRDINVDANGQIPLVKLSGLGAAIYNEIQNRDGGVLARGLNIAELNIADSLKIAKYDAAALAACSAAYPFEFQFALPVLLAGQVQELGLWMLQQQAIDVGVAVTFNPIYSVTASNDALWSGGTPVSTPDLTISDLQIERELYNIPNNPKHFPNLAWAHQVIEYTNPFTGGFSRFSIPRSGVLLRAIIINQDAAAPSAFVEYSDVKSLSWIYGSNVTPVQRAGLWYTMEYLNDYKVQPPKGVQVIDFYKWGMDGLKLVKDTEVLSNLRLETTFNSTTSGTQRIILDRLYPVLTRPA